MKKFTKNDYTDYQGSEETLGKILLDFMLDQKFVNDDALDELQRKICVSNFILISRDSMPDTSRMEILKKHTDNYKTPMIG